MPSTNETRYARWQLEEGEVLHRFQPSRFASGGARCVFKRKNGGNCNSYEQHPVHEVSK